MFAFRRVRAAVPKSIAAADFVVDDAENIVRLAWRRDLYQLRRLAEEQLQAAVTDGLQAYETLRRAQRDNLPRDIVDAHMTLEAARRLTRRKAENRDQIDALIEAEPDAPSSALPTLPRGSVRAGFAASTRRRRPTPPAAWSENRTADEAPGARMPRRRPLMGWRA